MIARNGSQKRRTALCADSQRGRWPEFPIEVMEAAYGIASPSNSDVMPMAGERSARE